jgi:hypothetical protein
VMTAMQRSAVRKSGVAGPIYRSPLARDSLMRCVPCVIDPPARKAAAMNVTSANC